MAKNINIKKDFKHFILTQFNVRFKWSKGNVSTNGKVPDKEWFQHRLNLFDKFCYPSIINQSNQNFDWLIFFDDNTTDKSLLAKYDRFIPVYIKNYKFWNYKHIINYIRNIINPKVGWLMTTRFDCDDSLGKSYIKTMQEKFSPEDLILNPVNGIVYDINIKKAYEYSYLCPNPYITTIEKITSEPLKTCFRDNHPRMRKYFNKFNQIQNPKYMWLQIIHDRNLGNNLRGNKVIKMTNKLFENFNVG